MPLTRQALGMLIDGLAGLPYGGEVVDQRTHALQTGWHAKQFDSDDELLLAATLHDIGRAKPVAARWPGLSHELCGAEFARVYLGERAAWIIAQHVPAKRYLVATDPAYRAYLSPASIASLKGQGGPMSAAEIAEFRAQSGAEDTLRVRRWDDNAKDPDGSQITIAELLDAYDRLTR